MLRFLSQLLFVEMNSDVDIFKTILVRDNSVSYTHLDVYKRQEKKDKYINK